MADPSSSRSSSSSTTPTPHSAQAAQAPHSPDLLNNSSSPPWLPSIETLVDRQALFHSMTNTWLPVPQGLILLPAVQHATLANGDASNEQQGSIGTNGAEHATGSSPSQNTGSDFEHATAPDAAQQAAVGAPAQNQGTWAQHLHKAREALRRMESCLYAPFGFDEDGNAIVWDPMHDPLPSFSPLPSFDPLLPWNTHAEGFLHETTTATEPAHEPTQQSLPGNPALIIEVEMVEALPGDEPGDEDADAEFEVEEDEQEEDDGEGGQGGVHLNHHH
ncbi:hypothetical protein MMC07_006294 [Pseudocyphellaria aurata]|nr:hypothetical protein [Pseudocyphellaria aurata]